MKPQQKHVVQSALFSRGVHTTSKPAKLKRKVYLNPGGQLHSKALGNEATKQYAQGSNAKVIVVSLADPTHTCIRVN